MIRGKRRKIGAWRVLPIRPAAAKVTVHAAVIVMAGWALATAAAPALAAPRPGGPAASHIRPATTGQHTTASRMNQGPRWAHIGLGADHTCATRANGTLWCWGLNGSGQLGIGNHTGQDRPRQVTTPAAGGWASVTAGDYFTCATRTGGTLWCWGDNGTGQLGIGNFTNQDLPRQVTTPVPGGWASVSRRGTYVRHPHRRHPVVLGLRRLRPARSHRRRRRRCRGSAAAGDLPGAGRLGHRHR